jgi:hypothetical protein
LFNILLPRLGLSTIAVHEPCSLGLVVRQPVRNAASHSSSFVVFRFRALSLRTQSTPLATLPVADCTASDSAG